MYIYVNSRTCMYACVYKCTHTHTHTHTMARQVGGKWVEFNDGVVREVEEAVVLACSGYPYSTLVLN